ncbi:MAG: hypothetical protein HY758_09730 [Nitrospirae bacterium]|nr:hypothetical protein [Nitrospirota bacterium]
MKTIQQIRSQLSKIPDALYEIEPEIEKRGHEAAIETIWDTMGERVDEAVLMQDPDWESDDSTSHGEIDPIFEIGAQADIEKERPILSGEQSETIRKSVEIYGIDALAWYVTFHAKGAQWGIYIPISSLMYLYDNYLINLEGDINSKLGIAFQILHKHELFHFSVDYMSSQWEMITSKPCHKPARSLKDSSLGYILLEEKLANAYMLRKLQYLRRF